MKPTFKKIANGTPEEIALALATKYRGHVNECLQCRCAEDRLRPAKFRCATGTKLRDQVFA